MESPTEGIYRNLATGRLFRLYVEHAGVRWYYRVDGPRCFQREFSGAWVVGPDALQYRRIQTVYLD